MKKILPFVILLAFVSFLTGLLGVSFLPQKFFDYFSLRVYRLLAVFVIFWILMLLGLIVPSLFAKGNERLISAGLSGLFFFAGVILSSKVKMLLGLISAFVFGVSVFFYLKKVKGELELYKKFAPVDIFKKSIGILSVGMSLSFTLFFVGKANVYLKSGVHISPDILEKVSVNFLQMTQPKIEMQGMQFGVEKALPLFDLSGPADNIEAQINAVLKTYFPFVLIVVAIPFFFTLKLALRLAGIFAPLLMLGFLKGLKMIGFYRVEQQNMPVDILKIYQ